MAKKTPVNYRKSLNSIKRKLDYYMQIDEFETVYIGATYNKTKRFKKYIEMELKKPLIKVYSYDKAVFLETALIGYAKRKYPNCNKSDYSVGLKINKNQYYIYMVADYDKCPNQ